MRFWASKLHGIATSRGGRRRRAPIPEAAWGLPDWEVRTSVRWRFNPLILEGSTAESGNRHVTRVGPNLDGPKACVDRQSAGCTSPGSQERGLLARAMQGRNIHLVSGGAL